METSNIIGGSNVYPCKGRPLSDQEFVGQIEDYNYIIAVYKMHELGSSQVHLTKKQSQVLEIEMRCVYAKNDPCWGYINGEGIKCRCIEGRCPNIKKCNPKYTSEQGEYWTMTEEARVRYGCPEKQKKYYLVDLVSDDEKSRYETDPKGVGIEFPPIPDSKLQRKKQSKPKGRRLVIIGYEETYFGDADNQLSPIWGYVDDSEDGEKYITHQHGNVREIVLKNARKIDEKQKNKPNPKEIVKPVVEKNKPKDEPLKRTTIVEIDIAKKNQYEKSVKDKLRTSYKLTELTNELIRKLSEEGNLNIILSNEAEMAYVSGMLLQANISHDIELCDGSETVCLWKAQAKTIKLTSGVRFVSNSFVEQGCDLETETVWAGLNDSKEINELILSGRDFFEFKDDKDEKRWGCRNLYGATHIAVNAKDFELSNAIEGEQKISLMKDSKNYIVLSTTNAEQIGITTEHLWNALESLKASDEISEFPRLISGLVLTKTDNGYEIKGIGHMKFDEY